MNLPDIRTATQGEVSPPMGLIDELCEERDRLLGMYREGLDLMQSIDDTAQNGIPGLPRLHIRESGVRHVVPKMDSITKAVDACIWKAAIDRCGFSSLMNADDLDELRRDIERDCPPVDRDTMAATLVEQYRKASQTFVEGLLSLFRKLDSRYRSHNGWKLGQRVIFKGLHSHGWGMWSSRERVNDLNRCLMLLDGRNPAEMKPSEQVSDELAKARREGYIECCTEYFDCRFHKNGNVHAWFTRHDLIDEANRLIAEYYGQSLGRTA